MAAGHKVEERAIVPDDPVKMRPLISDWAARPEIEAILLTGGTGICARDQTFETVSGMLTKVLPGYGEIFRMLSFQEIGPAAMLSRAIGGVIGTKILLTMPGSPHAVQLAMEKLIVPELKHLVREATK
jgi:molybdopterin adenylyltransferase